MKNINITSKDSNGINHHDISGHSDFDQYDKYPVNILKEPNDKLPARINPLNKEVRIKKLVATFLYYIIN